MSLSKRLDHTVMTVIVDADGAVTVAKVEECFVVKEDGVKLSSNYVTTPLTASALAAVVPVLAAHETETAERIAAEEEAKKRRAEAAAAWKAT